MNYDVLQADSYVLHLAALAKRHQIRTSEDVLNEQGAIIIGKGQLLDENITRRIVQHKLHKPLELSISFADGLSGERLLDLYHALLQQIPAFMALHSKWGIEKYLNHACLAYGEYPVLVQKISVLKARLPGIFEQALFVAYGAMLIALRMKKSEEEILHVFLAGLSHDIGMLHIPAEIHQKKSEYTPQEWHTMQSHAAISQCILQQMPGLHSDIIQAVAEHHERCDGSGYPHAKKEAELGQLGQIVALADTCYAIYQRELKPRALGPESLLAVLQFYPDVHGSRVFEAAVKILRLFKADPKRAYADSQIATLVSGLLLRNEAINHDYCVLYGLVTALRCESKAGSLPLLQGMTERLKYALASSGVMQAEHSQWLVQVCGQKLTQNYAELEQVELMYAEVEWQLKQMKRMVYVLWKSHKFSSLHLSDLIQRGLLQIEHYHRLHSMRPLAMS